MSKLVQTCTNLVKIGKTCKKFGKFGKLLRQFGKLEKTCESIKITAKNFAFFSWVSLKSMGKHENTWSIFEKLEEAWENFENFPKLVQKLAKLEEAW